ncbi:hypothetical protein P7K49_005711 [Saguinus oedipus]|uniref:Uncharacterized protein n=1 Tax=Saguinus oedipus TaxID=9490 RepID=A0ABQ9W0B9_SAGOE|nr:hypothetical protein P7K49_005711 [Saguinus oedipus]
MWQSAHGAEKRTGDPQSTHFHVGSALILHKTGTEEWAQVRTVRVLRCSWHAASFQGRPCNRIHFEPESSRQNQAEKRSGGASGRTKAIRNCFHDALDRPRQREGTSH